MNEDLQQQLVQDLLVESYEGLDRFDIALLELEQGGASAETMNQIFRIIHTIKGTSGCIGLSRIEKVAHSGENLLDELRSGERKVHSGIVSLLLKLSDTLRSMLQHLEANGNEGDKDHATLLEQLKSPPAATETTPAAAPKTAVPGEAPNATEVEAQNAVAGDAKTSEGWGLFDEDTKPVNANAGKATPPSIAESSTPGPAPSAVTETASSQPEHGSARPSIAESAIRVDVNQLDKLMNLVGELVLARNQILQFTANGSDNALLNTAQRLNIITTELQEGVMKTRMQQIGSIWSKYPRVIRDLSMELGKKVELVMDGQETELDRTVIESVKDPLMHILRNSVDHGIESPERRRAAGKPETGLLVLRAFHEGGQVNIEITDDGAGINVARVKAKAVERGVVTAEQSVRMSDREVYNLIFAPGFSTAEKVTNVSGRGVGMDVVKTNIEKIGGSVDVHSEAGRSTTIKIKIPLTLAIIPALVVTSGGERFAIPQVSLVELVRLEEAQARKNVEILYGVPVYRLRGKLLPLVYLKKVLAGEGGQVKAEHQNRQSSNASEIFARAREAHRAWLVRLRQVLDGTLKMSNDEAGSHQLCQLGKWIYAEGLPNFGDISEVVALEKTHQQFHTVVREIVATKNASPGANCEERLRELGGISTRVLELLTSAEKRILENQVVNIVVLQADGRQFGLVVDQINDTEEIVVKPLAKQLKSLSCFAGATIMGDGQVALILDVLGLAQYSHVVSGARDQTLSDDRATTASADSEKQTLLLFDVGGPSRIAIPLSLVARLEEIQAGTVENAAGHEVVQYRGQIMPLIRVGNYLDGLGGAKGTTADNSSLQVVVYSEHGRSVGLVVRQINDIVEEHITIRRDARRNGIAGSAVIHEKVTDLLDVQDIIRRAEPDFYDSSVATH